MRIQRKEPTPGSPRAQVADHGYTLVELLVVVVVLGVLGSVSVLAITGMSTEAAESGCDSDHRALAVAVESYFAQNRTGVLAPTGDATDADRFERTLVGAGHLRAPSTYHDLHADGTVTPQEDSPC